MPTKRDHLSVPHSFGYGVTAMPGWLRRNAVPAALCTALAAGCFASAASADEQIRKDLDDAAALVPTLSVVVGGRSQFGAGLVIGSDRSGLVIATANHVERQGDEDASSVIVTLKTAPDRPLPATVLQPHDRDYDLAVVRVATDDLHGIDTCALPIGRVSADMPARRGQGVYPIGNPDRVAWQIPVAPDWIAEVRESEIVFQSSLLDHGHSGGGLFDAFGGLVGMIKADQAPYGIASRLGSIAQHFREWGLPFATLDTACRKDAAAPADPGDSSREAVKAAQHDAARWLMSEANDLYSSDTDRRLLDAIAAGELDAVERLFPSYQDLSNIGLTPLHLAVLFEHPKVVKLLLLKGAKKNVYYNLGVGNGFKGTPLHFATRLENLEIMRLLVAAGADLENGWDFGDGGPGTPLTLASTYGLIDAANLLIRAGADVQVTNRCRANYPKDQRCPLAEAARSGNLETLKLLENSGAKLRLVYMDPSSLLSVAAYAGQIEMMNDLIARGLPVNCEESAGCESPLRSALQAYQDHNQREWEAINVLLRAGANPNTDFDGLLNIALQFGDMEALKVLLRGGADPNRKGRDGTPLAMALRSDHEREADILRAYGATK